MVTYKVIRTSVAIHNNGKVNQHQVLQVKSSKLIEHV